MKTQILTDYQTIRETESAILISTEMEKNYALDGNKEIWLPKSQIKLVDKGLAIADWLIRKNSTFSKTATIVFAHLLTNSDGSVLFVTV